MPAQPSVTTPLAGLAAAAAAGDEAAFARLHERLAAGLRRFLARRSAGSADEVEELAQRTWAAVWLALRQGRYDPARAAITTFLYAVASRTWLQERRERRRRGAWWTLGLRGSEDEADAAFFGNPPDPVAFLQACELLEAVRDCLRASEGPDCLTDEERWLVRAAGSGKPDRALAARLGVAASTVHARRRVAYGKIRRMLAARGFGGAPPERGGERRE